MIFPEVKFPYNSFFDSSHSKKEIKMYRSKIILGDQIMISHIHKALEYNAAFLLLGFMDLFQDVLHQRWTSKTSSSFS